MKNKMKRQLLTMGLAITMLATSLSGCKKENKKETEIENELEEKHYSPYSIQMVLSNDGNGNIEYHFVENVDVDITKEEAYEKFIRLYQSIIDPSLEYEEEWYDYNTNTYYSYCPNQRLRSRYYGPQYFIPDYRYKDNIIDAQIVPMEELYGITDTYTKEELQEIETKMNMEDFDIYESRKEKRYSIEDLQIIEIKDKEGNDYYFVFDKSLSVLLDESADKTDVTKLRPVIYYYDLLNPKNGIKCNFKMNALEADMLRHEEKYPYEKAYFEKITSLDKNFEQQFLPFIATPCNIEACLTDEQKARGILTYDEIESILNHLNKMDNVRTLTPSK